MYFENLWLKYEFQFIFSKSRLLWGNFVRARHAGIISLTLAVSTEVLWDLSNAFAERRANAFCVARSQCDKNLNYDSNKCQYRIFKDVIYFIRECAFIYVYTTSYGRSSERKYKMCRLHEHKHVTTPRVSILINIKEDFSVYTFKCF